MAKSKREKSVLSLRRSVRRNRRKKTRRHPQIEGLRRRQLLAADMIAVARPDAGTLLDHFVDTEPLVDNALATNDLDFKFGFNSTAPGVSANDQIVVGDWSGLGFDQAGAVREVGITSQFLLDTDRDTTNEYLFRFGSNTDTAIAGDFNGDGFTDVGVARDSGGAFLFELKYASTTGDAFPRDDSTVTADATFLFGFSTDDIAVGDYDGDGFDDIAVVRDGAIDNDWFITLADAGTPYPNNAATTLTVDLPVVSFGTNAWIPLAGDFDDDGTDDLVVHSPGTSIAFPGVNEWSVDTDMDGITELLYAYGLPGDIPYIGQFAERTWDGGGDGSTFSDAANWSDDTLPGPSNSILIDQPNAVTLNVTGSTTISDLRSGEAFLVSGGTLSLAGPITVAGGIDVGGAATLSYGATSNNVDVTLQDGATLSADDGAFIGGNIILAAGANATIQASSISDTVDLGDILGGPTGSLTFDGGTFDSFGAHGYTGAVTLQDDTTLNLAFMDADITLAGNNSRLGGAATVANVTAQTGSTVSPGNSPGTMNTNDFDLQAGSTLEIELGGLAANPGVDYDQVNVTGSVTLGGTLDAVIYSNVTLGEEYVIISNDGVDSVTGTFSGLADDSIVSISGTDFIIDYDGGDGNDVTLTAQQTSTFSKFWDGGGDGVNWSDALNWSSDTLPDGSDNVLLDVVGDNTISVAGATINSISQFESLEVTGGTLGFTNASTFAGNVLFSGGIIRGLAPFTPLTIEGTLTIDPDGSTPEFRGDAGGDFFVLNEGLIDFAGSDAESIQIGARTTVTNQPGGTIDFSGGMDIVAGGIGDLFNQGTISVTSSTGTVGLNINLDNSGSVNVADGTLELNAAVAQTTGTVLTGGVWEVGNGSTLSFTADPSLGTNQATVTLRGTGNFTNFTSPNLNTGTLTLADSASLATGPFTNSGTLEIQLTSSFVAVDSYTQSAGTTIVDGSLTLVSGGGTPSVSINGGTLAGNGTFAGSAPVVGINAGGTIAPGNGGAGSLSLPSTLTLDAASTTEIELSDGAAGVNYDQIATSGVPTLDGTLSLTSIGTVTAGQQFTIIDGGAAVSGTFAGLAEGATVSDGTNSYTITYAGGLDGFDVVLTAVNTLTVVSISSGDLFVQDAFGNTDVLEISTSGTNFLITDTSGNNLSTSIVGATGDGTSTITVPNALVTGTEIRFETGDGDDQVAIETLANAIALVETLDFVVVGGAGTDSVEWGTSIKVRGIDATAESWLSGANINVGPGGLTANITNAASFLGPITAGTATDGSDVSITAGSMTMSDVFTAGTTGNAGSVTLNSGLGIASTGGFLIDASSTDGNGGAISVTATEDMTFTDVLSFSVNGSGGDITLSGRDINADPSGIRVRARVTGDDAADQAGDIMITATGVIGGAGSISVNANARNNGIGGNITVLGNGDVNLRGVNTTGGPISGGDGGALSVTSTTGSISAEEFDSSSSFGSAGSITVDAATSLSVIDDDGEVLISSATTSSNPAHNAGNILVTAGTDLTYTSLVDPLLYQNIDSSAASGVAGSIDLTVGGTVTSSGFGVFSFGSQSDAGDVNIVATSANLLLTEVDTSSVQGSGGDIAISSVNLDADRLRSRTTGDAATDQAGTITVTATGTVGQSTPIRLDARALDNGIGGAITLNAAGNVQLRAVTSRGGNVSGGDGGAISLTSTGGSITSEEIVSASFFGSGGNITVDADTTVTIDGDDDLGSTTDGTLNSSTQGTGAGNNGGNISVTAGGDFTLQNLFDPSNLIIDSSTSGGAGGSITINSADWVTFGVSPNLLSVGNAGDGGTIVVSGANLFVGSVFSDSGQANAGDITLTASGDIGFIDVQAEGNTGSGGNIAVSGINIEGNRLGTRTTGDAATDQAGTITVTATGTVGQSSPMRLDARALDNGIGGAIILNAAGDVQLRAVTSRGGNVSGGDGGAISLASTGGSITSEEIVSTSFFGSGGNITVDANTTVTIDGDDDHWQHYRRHAEQFYPGYGSRKQRRKHQRHRRWRLYSAKPI